MRNYSVLLHVCSNSAPFLHQLLPVPRQLPSSYYCLYNKQAVIKYSHHSTPNSLPPALKKPPPMAPISSQTRLFLLTLLTLLILAQAKLSTLDPSDREALSIVLRDLKFKNHKNTNNSCNLAGISCEKIISEKSYFLRVTRINLDSRHLTGFLSPEIGRLSELRELSLSNNQISDRIPLRLANCRKIEIINLQNNLFSGEIISELSSLARLRVLDLSYNDFSGLAPFSKSSFRRLHFFDVSGNIFGRNDYPERYMLMLAEKNLTTKGRNSSISFALAPAPTINHEKNKHDHKGRNVGMMILGVIVGLIGGMFSRIIFSLLCKLLLNLCRCSGQTSGAVIFSSLIKKPEDLDFLEDEEALSKLEVIGEGGCGIVYKAPLPGNEGKIIAIKKVIKPPRDAAELTDEDTKLLNKKMRQVRSEIQTVGQIRHRNLLPLLAHVPRPDCHYLVYEFMKNGSLQDLLTAVSLGNREIDWLARYKIALGAVAGLEYLHLNHTPRIIHRDLKPGNILLDDNMEARISDFGLAKTVPEDKTHMSTSKVAGTFGYIAPEYYQTSKFTEKCDIFSFGVILGVLVIGKLPSDEFFQRTTEISLVKWMRNVMTSEEQKRAIDPKLMGNGFEEQMILVLKIACFCTRDDPKQRPNSKDVRSMLSQIEHNNPRDAE